VRNTEKKVYEKLFGIYRDAIVVLRKNKAYYMNTAARNLFSDGDVGRLIPEFVLSFEGEQFSTTVDISGEKRSVSVSELEGDKIITVFCPEEKGDIKAIDNFLGSISEELRSAMSVISMSSELLRGKNSGNAETYEAILTHNTYIAKRVMNNVDMIRVLNGKEWAKKASSFDLNKLCGDLIDSVNAVLDKGDLKIGFKSDVKELLFRGDRDKVELVLLNLLSNSLKYTDESGKITVETIKKGDGAVIKVSDTGEGIRPERLISSFSGFVRERDLNDTRAGSGVGLATVDYIAHMHDGFALLESTAGKGTTVTVLLKNDINGEFKDGDTRYETSSMDSILTELSDVLTINAYMKRYLD